MKCRRYSLANVIVSVSFAREGFLNGFLATRRGDLSERRGRTRATDFLHPDSNTIEEADGVIFKAGVPSG